MELQYNNNEEELFDFYKYINNSEKVLKRYKYFKLIIMLPVSLVISIILYYSRQQIIEIHSQVQPEDILIIAAPIAIAVLWTIVYYLFSKIIDKDKFDNEIKNMAVDFEEVITLKVSEEGLEFQIEGSFAIYYWNSIKTVIEEKKALYILINNSKGIVVPKRAFKEEKDKIEFLDQINKRKK